MSSRPPTRSSSVGALPREKKHFVSRAESVGPVSLDVRCACQYFQSDSLLPERINPVGSRPDSKLGFTHDTHGSNIGSSTGLLPNQSNIQADHLSTKSFTLQHERHPEADKISIRSFGGQRSFEKSPVGGFGLQHQGALDQFAQRGLVIRSISDANESEIVPPIWQQREMSIERHSKDPDTISNRSVGLRRISRTPSKTDLYVADINIPGALPRPMSRIDISHVPQVNVIAPTPVDNKTPFSVVDEFRKNKAASAANFYFNPNDKENLPEGFRPFVLQNQDLDLNYIENKGLSQGSFEKEKQSEQKQFQQQKPFQQQQELQKQQQELQKQQQLQQQQQELQKQQQLQQQQELQKQQQLQQQQELQKQQQLQQQQELQKQQQLQQQQELQKQQQQQELQKQQRLQQQQQELQKQQQLQQQQELQKQQQELQQQQQKLQKQQQLQQQQLQRYEQRKELQEQQQSHIQSEMPRNLQISQVQTPNSQPQLLKRHHPPEEESPPALESKQKVTEDIHRKHSTKADDEGSFFPSIIRKMSFRSSEPRELVPPNSTKTGIKSGEESSSHLIPNIIRKMSFRSSEPRELIPPNSVRTGVKSNDESSSHLVPNIIRKMSFRSSEQIELIPQLSVQVIEGPKKVVKQKPSTTPVASTVTETFCLKVDELDQYAPKKSDSVGPSRERSPFIRSATPVPITMADSKFRGSQPQLLRGSQSQIFKASQQNIAADKSILGHSEFNRELVSVPIDIPTPSLTPQESSEGASEGYFYSPSKVEKFSESENVGYQSPAPAHGFSSMQRTTSESGSQKTLEQKIMQSNLLRRKQYFQRAQSQDRVGVPNADLQSSRMIKTVSFDFHEHTKSTVPENRTSITRDKRDWLERTYFMRDHEYEPIGAPSEEQTAQSQPPQPQVQPQSQPQPEKEASPPAPQPIPIVHVSEPMEVDHEIAATAAIMVQQTSPTVKSESEEIEQTAEEFQRDVEDRYFSSVATTPRTESRTESRTDYIHTSQVDSSAIEELPLKTESRRKSFMASAQDRGKKMQANLKSQAVKIKSKIRGTKKQPSGSPKKERKRFKAPEFSKMKMPEMKFKAPDMSKFKAPEFKKIEFKRPEFTKFNKPDMSKFKMPETFSSLKLKRSKSLKESEVTTTETQITTPESSITSPKKMFEFNFGTYPRALRRKKQKTVTQFEDIPTSSETPPSYESATIPRGTRDKGPVGSRWVDKFSEVSYGDSESGKYQKYESSEPESVEPRESSLERKIRENLDRVAREDAEFEIRQTEEQKQFADFDEENRAIHEISKIRENEFKHRRPMVHQDSDLVSEESKEVGWSEKDILRNKLLKQSNATEAENFASEEGLNGFVTNTNLETQSTGSSSALRQKGVIEEIDDDEFFLRKRGISQDNIEIRQYISTAIREGFDTPINALAKLGNSHEYYPDEMVISNERMDYGYDVPPPKPRRVKRYNNFDPNTDSAEVSQEFEVEQKQNYDDNIFLPQSGSDYFQQLPPNRPLRKSKKQFSEDSQEVPDVEDIPYFDDEQMFFKRTGEHNNLDDQQLTKYDHDIQIIDDVKNSEPPQAPKRRKKQQLHESIENNGYLNGFAGRSVSNTFLPNGNQFEESVVYRTEHEYVIPLAQPEEFTPLPTPSQRSRSRSRITDDDRTSHGADSLVFNEDEANFKVEMKENDGYAIVKKEPPPRPPAPVRRKRSPNLPEQRFATMPHMKRDSPKPQRPKRNYSTIGPARPPRRKSSTSIGDIKKDLNASDATQYEELDVDIEDFDRMESPKNLQSGDVINKMKDRPLPPPPRPPREHKKHKYITDEDDRDGGAEKIIANLQQNGDYEIEKSVEKCIEVEVSTQTDPLPDDFVCEEFEITEDMKIIEPRRPKTLEDILKEEQEAELERARQLADEEQLSRGLQRFRESSQRSISERSRGSADRSKASLSRPATPAILIERRVPTPLPYLDQTVLEASLTVQPVDDDEIIEKIESEPAMSEKRSERSEGKSDSVPEDIITSDAGSQYQEEEERLRDNLIYKLDLSKPEERDYKLEYFDEADFALESNLERRNTVQEEPFSRQNEKLEENTLQGETFSEPELPPQPPPRRRSSAALTADQLPQMTSEVPASSPPPSTQLLPISELSPAPVQTVAPNRLAVADLEVERLSVHALQAGQITVSQLQGSQISADELECKSGNLVVKNLELPPGLIEEILERVRNSERPQSQAQTQTNENEQEHKSPTTPEQPPARPPPPPQHQVFPSEYMQYSIPPPSFYQLRSPTDDDAGIQPIQPPRRRRHHRRRDSSSEEESYRERRRSRQGTRSPEPTIGELGGQLLNACGTSVTRTITSIINYLRAAEKEGGAPRSNISTAIVILIIATLGFLILGLSGRNIHHHHWDFFNLPGNDGRGSKGN